MEITMQDAPIVGYLLLFVASITAQLRYAIKMPGNTRPHPDDVWLIYGRRAQNKTLLYWATMPGALASFGVPLKIGFESGFWEGVASFFVYNVSAFIFVKLITRLGIHPACFVLALIAGPIGLLLVMFDVRLIWNV